MSGERLELVTDFSTLRVGMLIVVKPCVACGRNCRFLLVRYNDGWAGWEHAPDCIAHEGGSVLRRRAVTEGRVFRVDVGDTSDASLEQETPVSTEARKPAGVR